MSPFNKNFGFRMSPFEQYVAEKEPEINAYAVKPPYFEETKSRALSQSTFILFGFRGSGKSATRITTAKETWKLRSDGGEAPIVVTFTDFSPIIGNRSLESVSSNILISHVAFLTIEALLLWLSNQSNSETLIAELSEEERFTFVHFIKMYYLSVPEPKRQIRNAEAMKLLHQTWINQSKIWVEKKWKPISSAVSKTAAGLVARYLPAAEDMQDDIKQVIAQTDELEGDLIVLTELVGIAKSIGFAGVSVFLDKVDEHSKTQFSAEKTAKLIHPILSHVQLLEVEGFGWTFFLWNKVKQYFATENLFVRLDKIAHSEVKWPEKFLVQMIDQRIRHFSDAKVSGFNQLCQKTLNAKAPLLEMIALVQNSPRELIRLLDTIAREYNSSYTDQRKKALLSPEDIELGKDVYIRDVVWNVYAGKVLSQIIRLGLKTSRIKTFRRLLN